MALNWGFGQSGSGVASGTDSNFTTPQTGVAATGPSQFVIKSQMDAGDAAVAATIDAPKYDATIAYASPARMTFTNGFVYQVNTSALAGETPITHPAKWTQIDASKAALDAVDTRVLALEGKGAASAPVARQENTYAGGLVNGDRLLVGPAPTAVLSGFANQVATVTNAAVPTFTFLAPFSGQTIFVKGATISDGAGVELTFTGTAWEPSQSSFVGNLVTNDANSGLAASQGVVLAAADAAEITARIAGDAATLARVDAPTLDTAVAHTVGQRRTWTDGLAYQCITAAAAGETPTSAATKWSVLKGGAALTKSVNDGAIVPLDPVNQTIALYDVVTGNNVGRNTLQVIQASTVAGTRVNIANLAATGSAGTALATVDVANILNFVQTTAAVTAQMATPTTPSIHKTITLENTGTTDITITGVAAGSDTILLPFGTVREVSWNGTAWRAVSPALLSGAARFSIAPITAAGRSSATTNSGFMLLDGVAFPGESNVHNPSSLRTTTTELTFTRDGDVSVAMSFRPVSGTEQIDCTVNGTVKLKCYGQGATNTATTSASGIFSVTAGQIMRFPVSLPDTGVENFSLTVEQISGNVPVSNSSESVVAFSDTGTGSSQSTTSTSYVDITNATTAIPSAGEWEVVLSGYINNTTLGNYTDIAITDSAGTVLAESTAPSPGSNFVRVEASIPSLLTSGVRALKAQFRTRAAGTANITNHNTAAAFRPRFALRKVGALASIPGTVAEVSGSIALLSNQATAANTTPIDVGLSFNAPESGTYEIEYEGTGSNAAVGGSLVAYITDAGNNIQNDSLKRAFSATANAEFAITGSCRMTLALGEQAKMRIQSGGANVATLFGNTTQGFARLKWRKVGGYVAGASVPNTFPSTGPITALGNTCIVGQINRVDTSAFATVGGLIVSGPLTGADGDWFGVLDVAGTFGGTNKQCVVAFQPGQTYKGVAQNYTIKDPDACVIFVRSGGTWRVKSPSKTDRVLFKGFIIGTSFTYTMPNGAAIDNPQGAMNIATGVFTAPRDGDYLVTGAVGNSTGYTTNTYSLIYFGGGTAQHNNQRIGWGAVPNGWTSWIGTTFSGICRMKAGETFSLNSTNIPGNGGADSSIMIREIPQAW